MTTEAVGNLVRFSRLAAEFEGAGEILALLARESCEVLGADGAVVFSVGEDGHLLLAAANRAPEWEAQLHSGAVRVPVEVTDHELARFVGDRLGEPRIPQIMLLVGSGDLYGALVLLFGEARRLGTDQLELARGMVDLAAVALEKMHHQQELYRQLQELERTREALIQTEKLRALGQLAGGVAHDLKNILAPIALQVDVIERNPDKTKRAIMRLRRIIARGLDTVDRLRAFGRPGASELERVEVNRAVEEAGEMCALRMLSARVRLELALGAPPAVVGDESSLVTVLINLVVNAVDAMPDGGRIIIRTGPSEGGACIEVTDSGIGIPLEARAQVFEPFFTTKGEQGTGLGLAMVHALVRSWGGSVGVQSDLGLGSTFRIWLPAQLEGPPAPPSAVAAPGA